MTDSLEKKITELAWHDSSFRRMLETDPRKALKRIGVEVPENIKLDIRQQQRDTFYYVIPPSADDVNDVDEPQPVINQMDLWQSGDLFVWIMPENIKEHLLSMRQSFRRNNQ